MKLLSFIFLSLLIFNIASAQPLTGFGQTVYGSYTRPALTWGSGWSHFMPYKMKTDVRSFYLIYNQTTGQVHFDRLTAKGDSYETLFEANWAPGWTNFTSFTVNKEPYFIAYNSNNGDVHINKFVNDGTGYQNLWAAKWGTGWTHFNTFLVNGQPALIAYNATTGLVHFDWINSNFQGVQTVKEFYWGRGWTNLTTYSNNNGITWYLSAYNKTTGEFHIDEVRKDLYGVTGKISKTISKNLLVSVLQRADDTNISNKIAEIVAYDPNSGKMTVWNHSSGAESSLVASSLWPKNLTHIVPFHLASVSPTDGLALLYSSNSGLSRFLRMNDRSKMACTGSKICEFKNTPLLNQIDPTIPDNKYKDAKLYGCYDTSIMMNSVSSIMNQSWVGVSSSSRSKKLLDVVKANGINSTAITTFQYDTALAGKPYYFSELISDIAGNQAIVKFPSDCDLKVYGSCASAEAISGDFSRFWVTMSTLLTTDALVRGIESGARYVLAHNHSGNVTDASGVRTISWNSTGPHKIVAIGFDKNRAFPLIINNPAHGVRQYARIVKLQKTNFLKILDSKGKEMQSWYAIETEGSTDLKLLDHVDHVRLY